MSESAVFSGIRAILTDIEGTTTSVTFVFDVLFPYARERMAEFVAAHASAAPVREQLDAVAQETGHPLTDDAAVQVLVRWIDEDRKITPLKALQGMIWEAGYRDGDFTGHVYPDAVRNLERWHAAGLGLHVYSSGSVAAQKLLFGHSDQGDLAPLFSGWFDTGIGAKRDAESYGRIVAEIGVSADAVLFLSDVEAELDAARAAGLRTCWLVRGEEATAPSLHPRVKDFDAIRLV